ncbi:ComEC/Rec2-related protein [Pseudoscardovia suis]|uniref:ComEC/Rec2-related protein n=2 Tax=Pseudoscardovia suis TaxID=987063 RepID=A0A261EYU6_9BIFI|nr:ComEC/Rec2-related protein [Pseudoscardovia suis]PJJ69395.1 ComEC/Rec2-related protein [Pseudoscardovia suis]
MVVPAMVAWSASAVCQSCMESVGGTSGVAFGDALGSVVKGALTGGACCVAAVVCLCVAAMANGYGLRSVSHGSVSHGVQTDGIQTYGAQTHGIQTHARAWAGESRAVRRAMRCLVAVCGVAMLCALVSATAVRMVASHDAVARVAAEGAPAGVDGVRLVVRVTAPAQASVRRGFTCSVMATALGVTSSEVSEGSMAHVTLWADSRGCLAQSGARYVAVGKVTPPQWGNDAAWMEVAQDDDAWAMIRAPDALGRMIARMQDAFLRVAGRLSDQGRVLVPGLTLGVMGQRSAVNALAGQNAVDAVYAAGLTDRFCNAGIMHLMAVSGGHFALVAAMVSAVSRRWLASRRVTAFVTVVAYAGLAAVLYPSDSVTRAAAMGCMGAACLALGRRTQAWSALSWTVLIAVVACPGLAVSYGFALSVTAVAGIVAFTPMLTRAARCVMPRALAQACAVTIAAQTLSLPVQVMMGTGVPLWSVAANAIVAPCVSAATICGLASFAVSWCAPSVGFALAWLASGGTALMERSAAWMGGASGVLAWPDGVAGGFLAAACEVITVALTLIARRMVRMRRIHRTGSEEGTPVGPIMMMRHAMRQWWRDTRREVLDARWDEPWEGRHGGV